MQRITRSFGRSRRLRAFIFLTPVNLQLGGYTRVEPSVTLTLRHQPQYASCAAGFESGIGSTIDGSLVEGDVESTELGDRQMGG
ncbi:hypothetical protein F4679DRAFT_145070 [Xylaria curta]|nr:hypothetical protein F4679DRAFT_145070 [Xylaria curta]